MKFLKALIAVLAVAGFLFAQGAGAKTEQVNSAMKMRGKIIKIDVKTGMVILKSKTEKDTLFVDSTATLISGDKVIKFGDFKKGANVNVTWEVIKGKKNATKIDEKIKGGSEKENY